ncbi:MAG TPA: FAD-binding oxidoreductase [Bryobacteraceae bacterium]|jgi:FAD/FMN-containing dehydrogenase|nr:FAD-binding oxidoreductase [Bryobacteraceae bacterium]
MVPEADSPYLTDASGYRGAAERIFLPESEADVAQILREAAALRKPVTIAGAGTGLTGGRVPHSGWLVCLERLRRLEVHEGYAICGAGALLREVQAAAGPSQFYAPDPTETGASVGGSIATNASGSRSFLYGATRRHVRGLRVLLADGETLTLRRGEKPPFEVPALPASGANKNTAGYYLREGIDYMDLFIGSEGTLGVVTEAELTLLPTPASLFTGVVFFQADDAALAAVDQWRPVPSLRMLEYLDRGSLDLLRPRFAEIPSEAGACVLIEREGEDQDWLGDFAGLELLDKSLLDESWFATGAADRERFRRFRHALPEVVNDLVRRRNLTKMGSDFAAPVACNREMLDIYRETLDQEFPGQYVIFGHIGDAHLHVNVLPANDDEWKRASRLMTEFARQAVRLGGTVSAEHGLGKRKRHLLGIQYTSAEIEKMKDVKRRLDPDWLLGPGTLFEDAA